MLEEENKIGEQPEVLDVQPATAEIDEGTKEDEGSPLGKFKDSSALLDAYNELQSEFTRKCQKLSDAEKKLQDVASINTGKEESNENKFAWENKIDEFLQSHKNASSLVEDITAEIINDENLKVSEDGLEKAYSRVIEKKYIPHEELVKNDEFLEKFVYSNEDIKNKIIKEYIASLQLPKSPVNISNQGFSGGIASGNKFNNLSEANRYVERMFKF